MFFKKVNPKPEFNFVLGKTYKIQVKSDQSSITVTVDQAKLTAVKTHAGMGMLLTFDLPYKWLIVWDREIVSAEEI